METSGETSEATPAQVGRGGERVTLAALAAVFFRIGVFSFGGGLAAWIHRETVTVRGWLTHDEFLAGLALGQILPGANVTNLAVYIGQRLRGGLGATTALVALLIPPFVCVLILARISEALSGSALFRAAMDGIAAAAVGMVLNIGIIGAQRFFPKILPCLVTVATFVAVGVFHVSLLPAVVISAPISIGLAFIARRTRET